MDIGGCENISFPGCLLQLPQPRFTQQFSLREIELQDFGLKGEGGGRAARFLDVNRLNIRSCCGLRNYSTFGFVSYDICE